MWETGIFFFCILDILSIFENLVAVVTIVSFGQMCLQNALLLNIYVFLLWLKVLSRSELNYVKLINVTGSAQRS